MISKPMQRIKWWTPYFFFFISLCLWACSQENVRTEKEDPLYAKAKLCLENKDIQEALSLFKTLSYRYERAPESHLELGLIFLNEQRDPLAALYHFRAYLDVLPYADAAPMVRQLMHTATKQFILQLPGGQVGSGLSADEVSVLALRLENERLKQRIQALETRPLALLPQKIEVAYPHPSPAHPPGPPRFANSTNPIHPTNPARKQTYPARKRTYTVEPGDTLSAISAKVYGNPNRWQCILDANRAAIPNPRNLKIGQELVIP